MPMIVSSLSVLSTGIVMNIKNQDVLGAYALTVGEAVLALGASFFFYRTAHCNFKRLKYKALELTDTTCLLVSAAVVLTGLSFLEIKGVSPARIIAVLLILIAVRFGSQTWGLIIALCLGFALGISRENSMFLLGAYAFSALVCGLFTNISSLGIGWVGESTLARLIHPIFQFLPSKMDTIATHTVSVTIAFVLITVLHVVIGELMPKSIALQYPDKTTLFVAKPMFVITRLFAPMIAISLCLELL